MLGVKVLVNMDVVPEDDAGEGQRYQAENAMADYADFFTQQIRETSGALAEQAGYQASTQHRRGQPTT